MANLREDLAKIVLESIVRVSTDGDSIEVRDWGGGYRVQNNPRIAVHCLIDLEMRSPDEQASLESFHGWLKSNTPMDVGRFKGMIPTNFEITYSMSHFNKLLRVAFSVDHIEAPSSVDSLMNWELAQLAEVTKIKPQSKIKIVKKIEHFDKELFDI